MGLNHSSFISQTEGRYVMGYGYIDDDKMVDVVIVNQKRTKFAVYYYDDKATTLGLTEYISVDSSKPDLEITSILVLKDSSDFQSLMVIYKETKDQVNTRIKLYEHAKVRGDFIEVTNSTLSGFELYKSTQPMLIDIDGDMNTDIILLNA